jgi:hypothetical protein
LASSVPAPPEPGAGRLVGSRDGGGMFAALCLQLAPVGEHVGPLVVNFEPGQRLIQ